MKSLSVSLPLAAMSLVISAAFGQQPTDKPAGEKATPPTNPSGPAPPAAKDDGAFLRIEREANESLHLQVAVRTYEMKEGAGPRVLLVGVAHIGQKQLYRKLQTILDQNDVVLFESVKPEGTGGAGGATDSERIESTKAAMRFIAGLAELFRTRQGRIATDMDEIAAFAGSVDPRLKSALAAATVDGWGGAIRYSAGDEKYDVISLGADGKSGGENSAADINSSDLGPIAPLKRDSDDGLQSELARTLGLEFQLDAINYDHSNWRCSDMSMDQLQRAFEAKGLDFAPIGGTLAGSSLPGKMASFLLRMVRAADAFFEGVIADACKVMLIEMLGDESVMRQALQQFGEDFTNVIVNQRNQVVIEDLKTIIKGEPAVKSVAIFYGAAHMRDMADRLIELGYAPSGEPQWIEAISVTVGDSKLAAKDIRQMRMMLRQTLRQQFPPQRQPHGNPKSAP